MRGDYTELALLVGGHWIGASERPTVRVVDPATEEPAGELPVASEEDVERALRGAADAFPVWRDTSPQERAEILHRAAGLLRDRLDEVAVHCTVENGKVLEEARGEVEFSADVMAFFAAEGKRACGTVPPSAPASSRVSLLAEPIGPVAAFTPWNYPITVPARKLSAALAAGCSVVLKAAEETPASALAVVRALVDAGVPAGVVNLLFTDQPAQLSQTVLGSPVTRMASFTGSTVVGKEIARLASAGVKPCMLELGNHAPVLVFPDADVERVVEASVSSKIHNAGQSCGSPTRFYVHERIHDEFVQRFAELASRVVVGDGLEAASEMGPLSNARRLDALHRLLDDARRHGARVALDGSRRNGRGYFFGPTLLTDVPEDAQAMNEEPFGPLALTARFSSFDEAIAKANRLPYGLTAYVFSNDLETVRRAPRLLESGMVAVNSYGLGESPDLFFGGVKQSGYGSDGGPEALRGYQVTKMIVEG